MKEVIAGESIRTGEVYCIDPENGRAVRFKPGMAALGVAIKDHEPGETIEVVTIVAVATVHLPKPSRWQRVKRWISKL